MSARFKTLSTTPPLPRKATQLFSLRSRSSSHNTAPLEEVRHTAGNPRYVFDEITDIIGTGSFGKVFKALDCATGEIVAVKRIDTHCADPDKTRKSPHLTREVAAMMCLKHENIVQMFDTYRQDGLYIVYEFAEHGDLFDWVMMKYCGVHESIRPVVSSRTLARIARQTGKALAYCHGLQIAQCDFKLENVIVVRVEPDIVVKLVDFGLSFGVAVEEVAEGTTVKKAGSRDYAAPELLWADGKSVDPYKTDVWAYGVLLFIVAHCITPWSAKTISSSTAPQISELLANAIEPHVRSGLRGIITQALQFFAADRPTMKFLAEDERISGDEANDAFCTLGNGSSDCTLSPTPPYSSSSNISSALTTASENGSTHIEFYFSDAFISVSDTDESED